MPLEISFNENEPEKRKYIDKYDMGFRIQKIIIFLMLIRRNLEDNIVFKKFLHILPFKVSFQMEQ